MAIIIGIDPGSRMTGYGIVQQTGDKLTYIDAGTIRTDTKEMPERLKRIFNGLTRITQHHLKYADELSILPLSKCLWQKTLTQR